MFPEPLSAALCGLQVREAQEEGDAEGCRLESMGKDLLCYIKRRVCDYPLGAMPFPERGRCSISVSVVLDQDV